MKKYGEPMNVGDTFEINDQMRELVRKGCRFCGGGRDPHNGFFLCGYNGNASPIIKPTTVHITCLCEVYVQRFSSGPSKVNHNLCRCETRDLMIRGCKCGGK